MFYSDNRQDTRQIFFSSWENYLQKKPLTELEKQVVAVILDHPEYHPVLEASAAKDRDYFPEMGQTNPFLHMGLHLALRDQIRTDRPKGISKVYHALVKQLQAPLDAEHLMIDCLAEALWQAQRSQSLPDEEHYLQQCRLLLNT